MFRFIHTADTHIDSPLRGLEAYDGAPVEALRGATRRAFENLVRLALDEAVDFIVIAGDLYDGDWKDFSTGLFFTRQMARLREAGIPVYVIAGNHDAASVLTRRLSLPDNVHFFSTRAAESKQVAGLPVVIHGRGFPHRAVPENLVPDYPAPVSGLFNIGLLHSSLNGAPGHDTYAPCTLRDLTDKGYDYWALGHVHQPQVLARDPWVVFPGNLQGRHIREAGARGCQLVSVSDSLEVIDAEHRPLDLVRWQRISVDLSAADGLDQASSDQPVRSQFRSTSDQPRFDQAISLIGDALRAGAAGSRRPPAGRAHHALWRHGAAWATEAQPAAAARRVHRPGPDDRARCALDRRDRDRHHASLSTRRACRPRRPHPHRARDPGRRARR